jgi:hypothetical protein
MGDYADDGYIQLEMMQLGYEHAIEDIEKKLKTYLHLIVDVLSMYKFTQEDKRLEDKIMKYRGEILQITNMKLFNHIDESLKERVIEMLNNLDIHLNIANISKNIFNEIEEG